MSKDQDKKKSKPEQKQIPVPKEKQKIISAELTDADLEKVAGGTRIAVASIETYFNPSEVSIDKAVPWQSGKK